MKDRIIRAGSFVRHEYLRLISVGCILLFAILPLLTLAFHVTAADWQFILKDSNFWSANGVMSLVLDRKYRVTRLILFPSRS